MASNQKSATSKDVPQDNVYIGVHVLWTVDN